MKKFQVTGMSCAVCATTVEKAVKEAERLLDLEGKYYESIYISTEEEQDEDGLTGDHNMIWLNGKFID